jgi:N-hydroxyarylamine O-acetyltransferase
LRSDHCGVAVLYSRMPEPAFDLDAYFDRIGYAGPREPTAPVLAAVAQHHALAIPFENLDVLLGRPIPLDVVSLEAKLVTRRRGGYCFEHNTLLGAVLRQLEFDVTPLAARGRWMVPPGVVLPRTHMLLAVRLGGERLLVDGGFGGVGVTAPLRMDFEGEQPSLYEPQQIIRTESGRLLRAKVAGEWRDLYVFTDEPRFAVDFEMANWFTSTNPGSRFKQNLIVTSAAPGVRQSLFNRELSVYREGSVERRSVDDPDELLEVLAARFGLSFPPGTRFGAPGASWAR